MIIVFQRLTNALVVQSRPNVRAWFRRRAALISSVIGDGFGDVERGIFAAPATASPCRSGDRTCCDCALAFRDYASNRGLQTRGALRFIAWTASLSEFRRER